MLGTKCVSMEAVTLAAAHARPLALRASPASVEPNPRLLSKRPVKIRKGGRRAHVRGASDRNAVEPTSLFFVTIVTKKSEIHTPLNSATRVRNRAMNT